MAPPASRFLTLAAVFAVARRRRHFCPHFGDLIPGNAQLAFERPAGQGDCCRPSTPHGRAWRPPGWPWPTAGTGVMLSSGHGRGDDPLQDSGPTARAGAAGTGGTGRAPPTRAPRGWFGMLRPVWGVTPPNAPQSPSLGDLPSATKRPPPGGGPISPPRPH